MLSGTYGLWYCHGSPGRQKDSGENFIPSQFLYCTSSVYDVSPF